MGEFETRCKDQPPLLQKALANKAMGFFQEGQLDECVKILEAGLAADPKSALAGQLEKMVANVKSKKVGGGN